MDPRRTPVAWVLNLDADLELGSSGPAYTPSRRTLEAIRPWQERLRSRLVAPGDAIVDERSAPGSARGYVGRAFCPTPHALRVLTRAGAVPEEAPPLEVLRRVNGRAFCAALGPTLPGGEFAANEADALALLGRSPPGGFRQWRAKRAFGMAGRGQRTLAPCEEGLRPDELAFVRGSFPSGLRIEPEVAIAEEVCLHGRIARGGEVVLFPLARQRCGPRGAWIETEVLSPDARDAFPFLAEFEAEVFRVAASLVEAGYFGPFGVDGFTYRRPGDPAASSFNARSEINARYSMGFPLA